MSLLVAGIVSVAMIDVSNCNQQGKSGRGTYFVMDTPGV
ncbi:hypothetical protein H9Q69_013926, partial [Fusarium xylarioides]